MSAMPTLTSQTPQTVGVPPTPPEAHQQAARQIQVLGWDDAVTACDCCGKTGLKSTVVVMLDGDIRHFGSVCATRHTGWPAKVIRGEIARRAQARLAEARAAYRAHPASMAYEMALTAARRAGVAPGVAFRDAVKGETDAARDAAREIAQRFEVEAGQLY